MSERNPLSDSAINDALGRLPGWTREEDRLTKTFILSSFREAISFIVRMSFEAEKLNHHPELSNVYNRVTVALSTHDAGNRITGMDVALAERIEHFSWA